MTIGTMTGACTCKPPHLRRDHRGGSGRCLVPGCSCLYGPPPVPARPMPERTRRRTRTAADGLVLETETDRTRLEKMLWNKLNEAGLPAPETQYLWARPERMFRSDFAYPEARLLIEVQGGIWARDPGRHNRASGFEKDLERSNFAELRGWRLLAFTERQIKDGAAILTIRRALAGSQPESSQKQETQCSLI